MQRYRCSINNLISEITKRFFHTCFETDNWRYLFFGSKKANAKQFTVRTVGIVLLSPDGTLIVKMAGFLNVKKLIWWLLFSAIFLVTGLNGDRITEKIYQRIDEGFSCFRRLNGTHQIGCSCKSSLAVWQLQKNVNVNQM